MFQPDPKKVRVSFAKLDVPRKSFDLIVPEGDLGDLHIQVSPRSGSPDGIVPCFEKIVLDPDVVKDIKYYESKREDYILNEISNWQRNLFYPETYDCVNPEKCYCIL